MATREDIYAAIRNADKAGDTEGVKKLVAYLQTMPADGPQMTPAQQAAHAKSVADTQAWQASMNPTNDMNGFQTTAAGIGKGMTDLVRGLGQRVGLVSTDDVAAQRATDAPLMASTGGKIGNVVGKVAVGLPTMFVPGANTVVGAGLIGAATGALEPTTADESVGKNMLVGGLGGSAGVGAIKGAGALYNTATAAAQPFYQAGRQVIVGRALNSAAGAEAPNVAARLGEAAQPFMGPSQPGLTRTTMGELVPGSMPTVAEASGNAGVSALQRAAAATTPDVTNQLTAIAGTQNGARRNLLEQLAGRDGARDFAAAERDATAQQLYGAARQTGANPAALAPEAQANIAAMQARIPPDVLNQARELARIQGMPMDDTTAISGMHYVKQALDDAIASARASGNATRARALTGLQHDYLSGMDALSPEYGAARRVYADMSRPVNQMDVAGEVLDRSTNPLTGVVQPAAYARALTDRTAAHATGFPGATLESTLTGPQQNLLQSILADLQRSNAAQNAGRGAGSDTVQKLAYSNILDQSGVPTFMRVVGGVPYVGNGLQALGNIAGRGADVAYGRANRELSGQLAQTMLSPADAAAAMSAATAEDTPNALLQLLRPYLLNGARLGTPALTNGSRQ